MNTATTISPRQAVQSGAGVLFLDVRTPAEYEEVHIDGAVLHPLSDINPTQVQGLAQGRSSCVVVCRSGGRARQAWERLQGSGISNLFVLEGGMNAWEGEGLPVVRGTKTISLERQVRIAAGALVFTGAVLGYFVHPAFIGISAFVGAGLMFAGITDTCGMGMMLAKMPWNTRSNKQSAAKGGCCSGTSCSTN
jgi:rhodanese-related sulfurtransferase